MPKKPKTKKKSPKGRTCASCSSKKTSPKNHTNAILIIENSDLLQLLENGLSRKKYLKQLHKIKKSLIEARESSYHLFKKEKEIYWNIPRWNRLLHTILRLLNHSSNKSKILKSIRNSSLQSILLNPSKKSPKSPKSKTSRRRSTTWPSSKKTPKLTSNLYQRSFKDLKLVKTGTEGSTPVTTRLIPPNKIYYNI